MTDTVSPFTGPQLTPMFATGAQPAAAPNTEPHPAPIFDTGPHPEPLKPSGKDREPVVVQEAEIPAETEIPAEAEIPAEPLDSADTDIPDDADIAANAVNGAGPPRAFGEPAGEPAGETDTADTGPALPPVTGHMPTVVAAHPVAVPGGHQFVKRWKFALIVAGVWVLAAAAGLGCYFWWYTALSKTIPVFGILLFVIGSTVASMLVSMVPNRPQVAALAIALMAAPLASMTAAAVLHGAYYFEWIARPVIG